MTKHPFALASLVRKKRKVVQISGFARNLNHLSSFFASEASKKKTSITAYFSKNTQNTEGGKNTYVALLGM
jgi:hypothetical protein